MNKIINDRENYMPCELFKYRRLGNDEDINENLHVDALINDNIYLSHPSKFNDPYDSAFSINVEQFKTQILEKLEQRIKETILKNIFEKIDIDIKLVSNADMIYQDLNIDMGDTEDLIEKELQIFYDELIKQIKFNVSCFSENPDSILMWSHYANQHHGFCIGYDTSKIPQMIKKEFYPVFYHKTFFPLIKNGEDINEYKFNSLIKYKDWKYENEWRLISNEKSIPLKPSKIYLGVRCNHDIDFFKEIAREKNCKLYKMKIDCSQYNLEAEEILF